LPQAEDFAACVDLSTATKSHIFYERNRHRLHSAMFHALDGHGARFWRRITSTTQKPRGPRKKKKPLKDSNINSIDYLKKISNSGHAKATPYTSLISTWRAWVPISALKSHRTITSEILIRKNVGNVRGNLLRKKETIPLPLDNSKIYQPGRQAQEEKSQWRLLPLPSATAGVPLVGSLLFGRLFLPLSSLLSSLALSFPAADLLDPSLFPFHCASRCSFDAASCLSFTLECVIEGLSDNRPEESGVRYPCCC
jgi:hypothetical protein